MAELVIDSDLENFTVDCGWDEAWKYQDIFGAMVRIAAPILCTYHSDLWWDVEWMKEHLDTGCATGFVYGVRPTGTHVGTDFDLIAKYSDAVWVVSISQIGRKWVASFVRQEA